MKDKPIAILVFIYNSYRDPLFQNLLLKYIKTLSGKGNYRFDLITFEQDEYALTKLETQEEKRVLEKSNIFWHPRTFHTGRFLLFKKLYDVLITLITVIKIKIKFKSKYVFSFANVSAAFSSIFAKFLNLEMVIYSYEPHSDFMAELGLWSKSSLQYKILHALEVRAARVASHIMTGTKYGVELAESLGAKAYKYRAPTAVDPSEFYFSEEHRKEFRKSNGIEEKDVFLYMGKFGDLYFKEEVAELFSSIYKKNKNSYFVIVTRYDHKEIEAWLTKRDIPKEVFFITGNLTDEEVKIYLSMADVGISAVPPTPSQKYRSPTKVAEYLLCGLPYITCVGISEDDDYAIDHHVGIVLNDFSSSEVDKKYVEVQKILTSDKKELRDRCRTIGLEYRSKERIDKLLVEIFK